MDQIEKIITGYIEYLNLKGYINLALTEFKDSLRTDHPMNLEHVERR